MALIGGWPGALVAQQWLRHKSAKREFLAAFWTVSLVNLVALGWLLTSRAGAALFQSLAGV